MTQNNNPVQRQPGGYNPRPAGTAPVRGTAPARGTSSARGTAPARGAAPVRGAAPARMNIPVRAKQPGQPGGKLPKGIWKLVVVGVLVIALGFGMQVMMPDGFPLRAAEITKEAAAAAVSEIHSNGPVRINEIMSSNGGTLVDETGETPDWVEIANISNNAINLKGYTLAKSANAGNVFTFPDHTLQPGECVVVIADSRNRAAVGEEYHAPFRLSSTGDVLMLFNAADVAIDTVNIPALSQNVSYIRQDARTWTADSKCTPGLLNTEENYRSMTTVTQASPVQVVEVMASNTQYAPDENGVFQDYVVLKNTSGSTVEIGGWYLSDTAQMARMWKIPAGVSLSGGETITIHCSGLNRTGDPAHLHTSFRLSSEGEQIVLSNDLGQPVDLVDYGLLGTDIAYIRGADGSWSAGKPAA